MRHLSEYLEGVLNYYKEMDIIQGDPNEGKWEKAHSPYPIGQGDTTILLLHEHHLIHDLWQSEWLDECHFFPPHALKILYSPRPFPEGWFDLCEICDLLSLKGRRSASEKARGSMTSKQLSEWGKRGGAIGGRIAVVQTDRICREREIGIYSKETQTKGGKSAFIQGKGVFAPENLGKGSKNTNSQKWQCLVTGKVTTPGPLTCYQRSRGIDTKQRKRIQ